jgi:hypothetical protein
MKSFLGTLLLALLSFGPAAVIPISWPQPLWAALRSGSVQPSNGSNRNSRGDIPTNSIRYGIGVSEEGKNSPDWQFAMLSKHSRAPWSERASAQRGLAVTGSYDPAPLNEQEMERYYLSEVCGREWSCASPQCGRCSSTSHWRCSL